MHAIVASENQNACVQRGSQLRFLLMHTIIHNQQFTASVSYQPAIVRVRALAKVGKLTRVDTSLVLSCKLVEVFAFICAFLLKNQAQDSVVPLREILHFQSPPPPCRISSLWRPFAMTHYNHLLFINCDHASCLSEATKQYRTAVPASALCVKILIFSTTIRYDTIRCESVFSCVDASPGSGNSLSLMYVAKRDENCI